MNQLDVYYRALYELSKLRDGHRECAVYRRAVASADPEAAAITVKRVSCTVEEDWICAIEEGLVHIEKAIKEERQFIYSNGEVVPIEKVKNVSTESVRHLAKHSNLIGKQEAGKDVVPDHLYTVERSVLCLPFTISLFISSEPSYLFESSSILLYRRVIKSRR